MARTAADVPHFPRLPQMNSIKGSRRSRAQGAGVRIIARYGSRPDSIARMARPGRGPANWRLPRSPQTAVTALMRVLRPIGSGCSASVTWSRGGSALGCARRPRGGTIAPPPPPPQWHSLKRERHSLKDAVAGLVGIPATGMAWLLIPRRQPSPPCLASICRSAFASVAGRTGWGAACVGTTPSRRGDERGSGRARSHAGGTGPRDAGRR